MKRSAFLAGTTAAALAPRGARTQQSKPDHVVRIENASVEVAANRYVRMTTYGGQFPGPLMRMREGRRAVIDIYNVTDGAEQLHFHGQIIQSDVDGASEEKTPYVPARGMRRVEFVPRPAGLRFYHTHLRAGADLRRGQYSGEVGPLFVEPADDRGAYDREVFLTLKEFEPSLSHGGDMPMNFLSPSAQNPRLRHEGETAMQRSLASGRQKGYEVGYAVFTINGRMLGHGDPLRVRRGERVLFHVLNGSATEIRSLALPGHTFHVVALDGNPVPTPKSVPVLWIGTAERVDAIVEMNAPGIWILGDTDDDDRYHGMGIVVEYAGSHGNPQWRTPPNSPWDYRWFAAGTETAPQPDETFSFHIVKQNAAAAGFNIWTLNGEPYGNGRTTRLDMSDDMLPYRHLREGRRYRIALENATDDIHPVHLHRHTFEITKLAGMPTRGVTKDVAMLGGYQTMEIEFVADNPGLTLFHCHQQLHMDFGFMALFDYAG
ncbi:MAG TPA: multicopper oxidase domain-containing protein [Candidatus Baltobacteraceae bacterium]|nr:multicopper oxidase domain-containing protein [Candidatus Baltobacteraceae bacterium]